MQQYTCSLLYRYAAIYVIFIFFSVAVNANTPVMPPYEQFEALTPHEREATLEKAFQKRVSASKNLYVRLNIEAEYREYDDSTKKAGKILSTYPKENFSLWVKDKKYRVHLLRTKPTESEPFDDIIDTFNNEEGERKSLIYLNNSKERAFGRIDSKQGTVIFTHTAYWQWLGGDFFDDTTEHYIPKQDYFFPALLENKNRWEVSLLSESRKIQVKYPFVSDSTVQTVKGNRVFVLDPEKDYMPVSIISRYDAVLADNKTRWQDDSVEVKESRLVNDIWMPTQITASGAASWIRGKNFYTINVSDIDVGGVSRADMRLTFPEGAEVVDAINGIAYKTDANGEPIPATIEPLYGLDPSKVKMPPSKVATRSRPVFIVAGLLLIGFALWKMYYDRKKRSGK